jgi:hypothetical protein
LHHAAANKQLIPNEPAPDLDRNGKRGAKLLTQNGTVIRPHRALNHRSDFFSQIFGRHYNDRPTKQLTKRIIAGPARGNL